MKLSAKDRELILRLAFSQPVEIPQPTEPPAELRYVVFPEAAQFVAQGLNVELSSFGGTPEEAAANLREAFRCLYELPAPARTTRRKTPAVQRISLSVHAEAV